MPRGAVATRMRSERPHRRRDGLPEALRPWAIDGPPAGRTVPGTPEEEDPAVPETRAPGGAPAGDGPGSTPAAVSRRPDAAIVELVTAALSKVTHHSVVVLDRDLRYRAVAGSAHRDGPFGTDAMLDRPAGEVLPPDVWARYGPLMHAALEGRTVSITETSHVVGHPVETTCSPVVADGRVVGVVAVSRDVVAAAVPDEPGEELRTAFGLTFDHSPICQALLSPDGRWVRVNASFCALLGLREADLVGRPLSAVIDPRDQGVEEAWLSRLREGRLEGYALPSRFVHADGHTIRVHVRLAAARGAGGELLGFVAQLIDLH